jgi:hypothetical protein
MIDGEITVCDENGVAVFDLLRIKHPLAMSFKEAPGRLISGASRQPR